MMDIVFGKAVEILDTELALEILYTELALEIDS